MGTADYIAPEQAADPRSADIRADIYSLGCTLFHLLTGRVPFPDGSVTQKLSDHARTPLPRLKELRFELPQVLEDIVARMTAKDPGQRYQTPAEVANALAPLVRAGSASDRKPRRKVLAAALLLAAVIAGIIILRLPTDRGDIVLTTDDPNLELIANKGGQLVRIRDAKRGQTLELDAKNYSIRDLEHPNGLALELPWRGQLVFKSSGGKLVVTTGPKGVAAADLKAPAKVEPGPPEKDVPSKKKESPLVEKQRTDPLTIKVKFPENLYLVRAKLKEVVKGRRFGEPDSYRFVIEQVFAGETGLKGKTFISPRTGLIGSGPRRPPFSEVQLAVDGTPGLEMLLWLRPYRPADFPHLIVQPGPGENFTPIVDAKELEHHEIRPFPYVKTPVGGRVFHYQSWAEGLAWAQEVERVYRAESPQERGDMLRRLAAGRDFQPDGASWRQDAKPDVQARWALAMLCNTASDEVRKQLRERAERAEFPPLSIRDGLVLDRMLCRLEGDKWYEATTRTRLLGACLEAETDSDFALACRRLTDAVRTHELTFTQFAALIDDRGRKLSVDQQWSLGRTLHVTRFMTAPSPLESVDPKKSKPFGLLSAKERDRAFTWLTGIAAQSPSSVVRVHAAAGLKHLRPFSAGEKKALKTLLEDNKTDADVRAELKALEAPIPTQEDETAARRAVTTRYDYLISPFYTGGWLVPRDKGWELPIVGKPTNAHARPEVIFAGVLTYEVAAAELLDLRPALTRDPLLKELASVVLKEPGFFYVVTARGDTDVHFLIRVQGGRGEMRGRMPALPSQPDPMEDLVRVAALEFVKAHNVKDMPTLDRLVAEKWCHGGQFWLVTDGGKNTLTLYATPNFGRYGSKEPLGTPGWGAKFPDKLHENILHVSRYEQQRPAFRGTVEEMRTLDKFVGEQGYVVSVGQLSEGGGVALLVRIEKDSATKPSPRIIGAMIGLQ
jgi:hypothetical protein